MIYPVDVPLVTTSGNPAVTDASGNFNSTTMIHTANWAAVRLVGQVAGSPTWSLLGDNNLPLDFAPGSLASMGMVLVAPGMRLTVQIVSASPNVAVSGHFVGVMSPALEEVLPYHTPGSNPTGVSVAPIAQVLGSVTTAVLAPPVAQSFPVPKGTQAIGFAGVMPLGGTPTVTVTGDQSGIQYFAAGTFIPVGPPAGAAGQTVQAALLDPFDTSVTIAISNATSSSTVELLAWATMPTVFARQLAGDVQQVNVTDRALRLLGLIRPMIYDGVAASDPGAGLQATATLIATVNKRWVLHSFHADVFGGGGVVASLATLQLRDGASGVGTLIDQWVMGVSGVGDKDHVQQTGLAIANTAGNALTLEFSAAVANMFQSLGFRAYQQ